MEMKNIDMYGFRDWLIKEMPKMRIDDADKKIVDAQSCYRIALDLKQFEEIHRVFNNPEYDKDFILIGLYALYQRGYYNKYYVGDNNSPKKGKFGLD